MKKIILFFAFAFIGLNAYSQLLEYTTHWVDSTRTLVVTDKYDHSNLKATIVAPSGVTWDATGQAFVINPKMGAVTSFSIKTENARFVPIFQWCQCLGSKIDQAPPIAPYEYSRSLQVVDWSGIQAPTGFGESTIEPHLSGGGKFIFTARWTNGWRECSKTKLALILYPLRIK